MYFYDPRERETKELLPGITARTFWGDRMLVAVVDLAPGAVLPNHSHPHEQAGTVMDGEMELTVAGERKLLRRGDVYIVPGDVEHSAVAGADGARVVDIFSPVREEYRY